MRVTRRQILPAFMILPRHVLGGRGYTAPSDKLNLAGVGVGGMGAVYLSECESENVAALCDVDDNYAARTFARYPSAKTYHDFRVMLEKEESIDAVVIGTPDHTHAIIAMAAIELGRHVYCAKPMTRTLHETRLLATTARAAKVATQMSVQSCASEAACATVEWVRSGVIGAVREAHVWSDRPVWPQGIERPAGTPPVPSALDWNLWLGPAPQRPYHPVYHPFNWRGWYDFGTGALGDMGCHTLHVIFRALDLGHPLSVQASANFVMQPASQENADEPWMRARRAMLAETFPHASIVTWDFPARGELAPLRLTWYDGGLKPPRPLEWEPGKPLPRSGILFLGEKGALFSGFSGGPRLVPESRNRDFTPPPPTLPRTIGHYMEWIEAAKGGPPANCNFDFGGLLTEVALLGTIAQRTGRFLTWDPENLRFPNDSEANRYIDEPRRSGWDL